MKKQNDWSEVDERFDKEFTCVVTYEKWPDEEEQRLREPQYKFKDFPNTNPKIIKNFLHSELEKVRQETIEECLKLLPCKTGYIQHMSSKQGYYEGNGWDNCVTVMKERLEALSINKKDNEQE